MMDLSEGINQGMGLRIVDNLAEELNIKAYKEISAATNNLSDTIETVLSICKDPKSGLIEEDVKAAKR